MKISPLEKEINEIISRNDRINLNVECEDENGNIKLIRYDPRFDPIPKNARFIINEFHVKKPFDLKIVSNELAEKMNVILKMTSISELYFENTKKSNQSDIPSKRSKQRALKKFMNKQKERDEKKTLCIKSSVFFNECSCSLCTVRKDKYD